MNTERRPFPPATADVTLLQAIAALAVFGVLTALLVPVIGALPAKKDTPDQLSYAREIYVALRAYAADQKGQFPTYPNPPARDGVFMTSNEAFDALLPRYFVDKRPFFHKESAWCTEVKSDEASKHRVLPGENDWCYVRGFTAKTPPNFPILANAFAPGTYSYVKDPAKLGGVWKAEQAIVVWVSGHAEKVKPAVHGLGTYIPRKDRPEASAFEKDVQWLLGEDVQVLFPMPPPPRGK